MEDVPSKLTVFFENPFWVGVFERHSDGKLQVCKVVFGAEPKDSEIQEFILSKWNCLVFSDAIADDRLRPKPVNPKRLQKMIKKEIAAPGIGTKAQQALKLQYEQGKIERKSATRFETDQIMEQKYNLQRQKHKEKLKGH
jgi:hypothetical protein